MADGCRGEEAEWWLKEAMVRHMPVIRPISLSGRGSTLLFFCTLRSGRVHRPRQRERARARALQCSRDKGRTERSVILSHLRPLPTLEANPFPDRGPTSAHLGVGLSPPSLPGSLWTTGSADSGIFVDWIFCQGHETYARTRHIGPWCEAASPAQPIAYCILIFCLPVGSSSISGVHLHPPRPFALAQQTCGRVTTLSRIKQSSHPGSYARCSGPAPPPTPHRSFRRRRTRVYSRPTLPARLLSSLSFVLVP